MPTSMNPTTPRLTTADLRGVEVPQDDKKVINTASHTISLATKMEGKFLPDFHVTVRTMVDPEAASLKDKFGFKNIDPAAVKWGVSFEGVLRTRLMESKSLLYPSQDSVLARMPSADKTLFAYNNIVGQRRELFFNEAKAVLDKCTFSSPEEASKARQALNLAHEDVYRNQMVKFDCANTGTYWSYGHQAGFVHIFEKMRDSLKEDDPRRAFFQKEIDFIYKYKWTPEGHVDENDIEWSLKMSVIDEVSRHRVSMDRNSEKDSDVKHVYWQFVDGSGFAYRDGNKFYNEKTFAELSPAEVSRLGPPIYASSIVFRPFLEGETYRRNYRADWDGNGRINSEAIPTGWWGHCDLKAVLESMVMDASGSGGIEEYNADAGKKSILSRADLLEACAAVLNFSGTYVDVDTQTEVKNLSEYSSAGGRFDDNPDSLCFSMHTGEQCSFGVKVSDISEKANSSKSADMKKLFLARIPDERLEKFSENPAIVSVSDKYTHFDDVRDRRVQGRIKGKSFGENGNEIDVADWFVIDPRDHSAIRPIVIDSQIENAEDHLVMRTYFDPRMQEIFKVPVWFALQPDGRFVGKEDLAQKQSLGRVTEAYVGREMQVNDGVVDKLKMIEKAQRTGDKICADNDPGPMVWNGEEHTFKVETQWRSPDKKWERVRVYADGTYGANREGIVLLKRDDEGNIVDTCEITPVVDFFWQSRPRVAPLIFDEGKWYANQAMLDRGVLDLGEGKSASLRAIQDLYDLIYLGFKAKDQKPIYTIVYQGKRLVYEDKETWKKDMQRVQEAVAKEQAATAPRRRNGFMSFFGGRP